MSTVFNEDWTVDVISRMHKYRISNEQLADEYGCSSGNMSTILNGHKKTKPETKEKVLEALRRIESRLLGEGDGNENTEN